LPASDLGLDGDRPPQMPGRTGRGGGEPEEGSPRVVDGALAVKQTESKAAPTRGKRSARSACLPLLPLGSEKLFLLRWRCAPPPTRGPSRKFPQARRRAHNSEKRVSGEAPLERARSGSPERCHRSGRRWHPPTPFAGRGSLL